MSSGIWIYTIQVTLEQEPIPESVEIWHSLFPVQDAKVEGKAVTFAIETGEPWSNKFDIRPAADVALSQARACSSAMLAGVSAA